MKSNKKATNCRLGTVGGQAVLEGIMMKGKEKYSIAVRREDGSISLSEHSHTSVRKKHKILNIPILRGIVGFGESMVLNFKTLSQSAEQYGGLDEVEPESKFEKWLTEKLGDKLMGIIMGIAMVLGVALCIGLFFYLPTLAVNGIDHLAGGRLGMWKSAIEGIIKMTIFVLYLLGVSLMKDIRRTFEYHGAEHKTIFCYESGEELTVENVKKHKRFHPRCGTSFIFVVLTVSILLNSLLDIIPFIDAWGNPFLRILFKMVMLLPVVGISFEFIMLAGKHDNLITRILSYPGLLMQRITTREPDDSQIEVAIVALKSSLPDDFPDFVHYDPHNNVTEPASDSEEVNDEANNETAEATEETNDGQGV